MILRRRIEGERQEDEGEAGAKEHETERVDDDEHVPDEPQPALALLLARADPRGVVGRGQRERT